MNYPIITNTNLKLLDNMLYVNSHLKINSYLQIISKIVYIKKRTNLLYLINFLQKQRLKIVNQLLKVIYNFTAFQILEDSWIKYKTLINKNNILTQMSNINYCSFY